MTQPWRQFQPAAHLRKMNKAGTDTLKKLRQAGFKPYLVTYTEVWVDSRHPMVPASHAIALTGIYARRGTTAAYIATETGWVYDVVVKGAALINHSTPFNREDFLRRHETPRTANQP